MIKIVNKKIAEYDLVEEKKRESPGAAYIAEKQGKKCFVRFIPLFSYYNNKLANSIAQIAREFPIDKNLIRINEIKKSKYMLLVETPYYQNSLEDLVEQHRVDWVYFSEKDLRFWLYQAITALNRIHRNGHIHGHIKLSSFFIDETSLLLDLNCSGKNGCIGYSSPESYSTVNNNNNNNNNNEENDDNLINNNNYDYKSDIFALGCVFYTVSTLVIPFASIEDLYGYYISDEILEFNPPDLFSEEYMKIVGMMIEKKKEERKSLDEILKTEEAKILFDYEEYLGINTIDSMIYKNTLNDCVKIQLKVSDISMPNTTKKLCKLLVNLPCLDTLIIGKQSKSWDPLYTKKDEVNRLSIVIIGTFLPKMKKLRELWLNNIGLENDGFIGCCQGIMKNPSIAMFICNCNNNADKKIKEKYKLLLQNNRIWDDLSI